MLKWQRNYRVKFEIGHRDKNNKFIPEELLEISYPFTCQIDINLGTNTRANRGVFQFLNLSRNDQVRLWLDIFNAGKKYIYMEFYAGYGENMPLVFAGLVRECTSAKPSGSVDWITEVQASDGGQLLQYGFMNDTYTQGTKLADIINLATKDLKNTGLGYITPEITPIPKDRTFIGQTMDILGREYGGYQIFIEKGEINILGDNDVVPGQVLVITDETGLLGSPKRAGAYVLCDLLFEPQFHSGQAITLLSTSLNWANQSYQIVNVAHKGIFSPNACGKLITSVTLSMLIKEPKVLEKSTPTVYKGKPTTGIWAKPVQGIVTSNFGPRVQPTAGASTKHDGLDIGCKEYSSVKAPANGIVVTTGSLKGYGYTIYINHGKINGKMLTSRYAHLSKFLVHPGQTVYKGQQIALSGGRKGAPGAGTSTGPHLHFEVLENGVPVNPTRYIGKY